MEQSHSSSIHAVEYHIDGTAASPLPLVVVVVGDVESRYQGNREWRKRKEVLWRESTAWTVMSTLIKRVDSSYTWRDCCLSVSR